MLRSLKEILGYRLKALDGEVGKCKDFIFDSRKWVIRYMLADTGKWLPGRQVLISPVALGQPQWSERSFPVGLKINKIESAPGLDHDAPVSRQYEIEFHNYYGWPYYWKGLHLWGNRTTPWPFYEEGVPDDMSFDSGGYSSELRSVNEVLNYRVMATDERYGEIHDIIVNDEDWSISYLVVDNGSWLFGKKILVAPGFVSKIDYFESHVCLNASSDHLKEFPEYDSHKPVNTEVEAVTYDFKGRPH
ncbi:MAG: PRC-barrel domain-containing protein [Lentisphaeraceae bacterium]|nr:PRC-barrel domain-containing protein [Lentisphaeraceae bacterium]